ncbi:hypothetical protein D3C72_239530 [compost metagenome]
MPFDLPGILKAASSHTMWLWVAVSALALLGLTAKLLNWLATLFERCPHCDTAVRVKQRICHHCFKAVKPLKPGKSASPRATRPFAPPVKPGR